MIVETTTAGLLPGDVTTASQQTIVRTDPVVNSTRHIAVTVDTKRGERVKRIWNARTRMRVERNR